MGLPDYEILYNCLMQDLADRLWYHEKRALVPLNRDRLLHHAIATEIGGIISRARAERQYQETPTGRNKH
ncbi:hypothetical protein GF356_07015 [candidate division GN15 bacterium]|nr:hypothetical protein [candidate division GN15 bacterium]